MENMCWITFQFNYCFIFFEFIQTNWTWSFKILIFFYILWFELWYNL